VADRLASLASMVFIFAFKWFWHGSALVGLVVISILSLCIFGGVLLGFGMDEEDKSIIHTLLSLIRRTRNV
jgi:hypothetical protein